MNLNILQADAFLAFAGFLLLAAFWVKLWQAYALDKLRQDLFDLRDSFFDRVMDGESAFTFKSREYRATREDLNRMIRFTRQFGLLQILVTAVRTRTMRRAAEQDATAMRSQLNGAQLDELKEIDHRQGLVLIKYLARVSPCFWIFAFVATVWVTYCVLIEKVTHKATSLTEALWEELVVPVVRSLEIQADQRILVGRIGSPIRARAIPANGVC